MRRISVILITLTLIFGLAISSHAILIDRGGGMIYSTDLKRKGSSLLLTLGNVGGHFPNVFLDFFSLKAVSHFFSNTACGTVFYRSEMVAAFLSNYYPGVFASKNCNISYLVALPSF